MFDSLWTGWPDAGEMEKADRKPWPAPSEWMVYRLLFDAECRVVELDVALPLFWNAGLWENRGHRAHRFACAAVDALFWMDEQHRLQLLFGDARLRRDVRRLPRGMTCLSTPAPVEGSGTTNAPTS